MVLGAFISKKEVIGAMKNIVKMKANATPMAIPLPKFLKGSISRTLKDKNPIHVVIVVRKSGCKFSSRLLTIDTTLELPLSLC